MERKNTLEDALQSLWFPSLQNSEPAPKLLNVTLLKTCDFPKCLEMYLYVFLSGFLSAFDLCDHENLTIHLIGPLKISGLPELTCLNQTPLMLTGPHLGSDWQLAKNWVLTQNGEGRG